MTTRHDLADLIIERLNKLIENPDVRADIQRLIGDWVICSEATLDHPTIQASPPLQDGLCECGAFGGPGCGFCKPRFGVLGLLNGLVGIIPPPHAKAGHGYITAFFDANNKKLLRFARTENT
jgi:hypothetical protein